MINETHLKPDETGLPDTLQIWHPPGTFAPSQASRVVLQAIANDRHHLRGVGLEWGCGSACLSIAAAMKTEVNLMLALEIDASSVTVAKENARLNRVGSKCVFLSSDSYTPFRFEEKAFLNTFEGKIQFILANPPSSKGDDGTGLRRCVLEGARRFLAVGGAVFLTQSYQYGASRLAGLTSGLPELRNRGVLRSTGWEPFDLEKEYLLQDLRQFVAEEERGGSMYDFRLPDDQGLRHVDARTALAHYEKTGFSPLTKWQVHLFEYLPTE